MAEIDPVRMSIDDAVELFRDIGTSRPCTSRTGTKASTSSLSDEGKALVLTFWSDEEAADAGIAGGRGFYAEQIEKFVTLFRAAPGRETYEVVLADAPQGSIAMNELFGIPMDKLVVVLMVLVAVALGSPRTLRPCGIACFSSSVSATSRRRRGRTALIVVGLMLGTTIIAAALTTGDTMSHTIRATTTKVLGRDRRGHLGPGRRR